MGILVDIACPFSVQNYDAVYRLLAISDFQLINPRTGTTLEITLAEFTRSCSSRCRRS